MKEGIGRTIMNEDKEAYETPTHTIQNIETGLRALHLDILENRFRVLVIGQQPQILLSQIVCCVGK